MKSTKDFLVSEVPFIILWSSSVFILTFDRPGWIYLSASVLQICAIGFRFGYGRGPQEPKVAQGPAGPTGLTTVHIFSQTAEFNEFVKKLQSDESSTLLHPTIDYVARQTFEWVGDQILKNLEGK